MEVETRQVGFSLIEILIVLTIGVTVVLLTTANLESFRKSSMLDDTTNQIVNSLNLARSKTLSGEKGLSYKVHFTDSTYSLLDTGNNVMQQATIDNTLVIVPPAADISFDPVTGKSNGGSLVVKIKNSSTNKVVTVFTLGTVSVQ